AKKSTRDRAPWHRASTTARATPAASGRGTAGRTRAPTAARSTSGGHTRASAQLPQTFDHLAAHPVQDRLVFSVRGGRERTEHFRPSVDAVDVEEEVDEAPAL